MVLNSLVSLAGKRNKDGKDIDLLDGGDGKAEVLSESCHKIFKRLKEGGIFNVYDKIIGFLNL
jgi:hypothetical protein